MQEKLFQQTRQPMSPTRQNNTKALVAATFASVEELTRSLLVELACRFKKPKFQSRGLESSSGGNHILWRTAESKTPHSGHLAELH